VLKTVKVTAGKTQLPIRLATTQEIDADQNVRELVKTAEKDRWLAFRAVDNLPDNSYLSVIIGPGTPSIEGPRTTTAKQEFYFYTYGPLHITNYECGFPGACKPHAWWRIHFNNPIDKTAFQESQLLIQPAVEKLQVIVQDNTLIINGAKKPETTFKVTLDKSIKDVFGQNLSKDVTVQFKVGPADPYIFLSGSGFVVLDPDGPRELSLYTVNYQTVRVNLYAVEPGDWVPFQVYRQLHYRGLNDPAGKRATLPGRLLYSKQLELKNSPNDMVETTIDLTPAFKDGLGQALVEVESINPVSDRHHNPLLCWAQSTQIGLDAFLDNKQLIGWANSLVDGAPLSDVKMEILPAKVSAKIGRAHV